MVMNSTSAVEVSIQAVSPALSVGLSCASARPAYPNEASSESKDRSFFMCVS